MRTLLIGGCPGSGKTSVARAIAGETDRGVHIETDAFFRFVPNLIDPSTSKSKAQNETIIQAYCMAATAYINGGYNVILEGVVGPWLFPSILPILNEFDYVMLDASLETVQMRVRFRSTQDSARPSIVGRMHPQFDRVKETHSKHVLDTDRISVDDAVSAILKLRTGGTCVVNA